MNESDPITSQEGLQSNIERVYPELIKGIGYQGVVGMIRSIMGISERNLDIFRLEVDEGWEIVDIADLYHIIPYRVKQIRNAVNEKLSQIYDVEEYVVKARRRGIENALILWENTDPITILLGHNLGIFRFGSIKEDFEISMFTVRRVLHERGRATLKQIEKGDILPILVSVFRENLTLLETAYKLGRSISYVYLVVTVFVKKSECE
jgi:hypothetical protein